MAMGWWRPFFFFDPSGVQLLVAGFALDGFLSYLLGAACIAGLCFADRLLAAHHACVHAWQRDDTKTAALYAAQRLTGGLIMLLLMSFNVPVFGWVIVSLGLAERATLHLRAVERLRLTDRVASAAQWSEEK